MEKELEKLKKEVLVLNERLSILEGKEHRRSIFKSIKLLINIIVICGVVFGIWTAYDYITNYIPDYLDEKIEKLNPFSDMQ